jgi:hypothetical protein
LEKHFGAGMCDVPVVVKVKKKKNLKIGQNLRHERQQVLEFVSVIIEKGLVLSHLFQPQKPFIFRR